MSMLSTPNKSVIVDHHVPLTIMFAKGPQEAPFETFEDDYEVA